MFFSEEKNQKTFILRRCGQIVDLAGKAEAGAENKSLFASFSSEKEVLADSMTR